MPDINEKVVEIVAERLNVGADTVTGESSFKKDLGASELEVLKLMMGLEEAFDMAIPYEPDRGDIRTVGEVVSYIESKADDAGGDDGVDDGVDDGGDDGGEGEELRGRRGRSCFICLKGG